MTGSIALGILMPFFGTSLGAAVVFLLKNQISAELQKLLAGFAAGVVVAASFRSLLQPALECSEGLGRLSFFPAAIGFLIGIGFLLLLEKAAPQKMPEASPRRASKLILAVTLHNIPEGMAVGVAYTGCLMGEAGVTQSGAFALALGIAVQNFPEGAIISMPLKAEGTSKSRAFWCGVLSGAVEPLAAVLTLLAAKAAAAVLPYLLAFAAGAMLYMVEEELMPEMSEDSNAGILAYAAGFVLMMILDVALG